MPDSNGTARDALIVLQKEMGRSIIGQDQVVERLLLALLANGNVLMEGLPGLAKTRAIKSLSKVLESDFRRIQFTPDLLPSDVTGTEVYYDTGGQGRFEFQPGPIFGNLILADEINRAPAKVQAALLEAMEERQVTVAGTTHRLQDLFMVLATQNPIEQEGTYPLPEAQMDRFLMHVMITYADTASEVEIIRLVRGEEQPQPGGADAAGAQDAQTSPKVSQEILFEARREVHRVSVAAPMESYMVDIVNATREPQAYSPDLARWIHVGASPRGSIALDKVARAHAWLNGQDHVVPDNLRAVVHDCLRHRLALSYEAQADGVTADDVIRELMQQVAVV